MTFIDAPDFVDPVLPIGDRVVALRNHAALATETFGPFDVTVWEGVQLKMDNSNNGWNGNVTIDWWWDAAATVHAGQQVWHFVSFTQVIDTSPCYGPYMTVTVNSQVASIGTQYDLDVATRRHTPHRPSQAWMGVLLASSQSIGAGATSTFIAPQYCMGPCLLAMYTDATTWTLRVEEVNSGGGILGWLHYTDNVQNSQGFSQRITLGGLVPQVVITNKDAAPHTFHVSITTELQG